MALNGTLPIQNNETISEMFKRTGMNNSTMDTVCDEIMKEMISMKNSIKNQLKNIPLNSTFKDVFSNKHPKLYAFLLHNIKNTPFTVTNLTYKQIAKQLIEKGPTFTGPKVPTSTVAPAATAAASGANQVKLPVKQFAVGYHYKEYDGYRMATAAEWMNRTFQAALIQAHQEDGGWPLLEDPLICTIPLCVAEGEVKIDGAAVGEVGFTRTMSFDNPPQILRGAYPAMNLKTGVGWTMRAPKPSDNWAVYRRIRGFNPCLFVKDTVDVMASAASSGVNSGNFLREPVEPQVSRVNSNFAVGYYGRKYDGYHRATWADWQNPNFQIALLRAHQANGGWALLEEPFQCYSYLRVADGVAVYDYKYVASVGFDGILQELSGVYPAMNWETKEPWTTHPPIPTSRWDSLGKDWYVFGWLDTDLPTYWNDPCLFVKDVTPLHAPGPLNAPEPLHASGPLHAPGPLNAPAGGARRSRRHKRRNYVKKQKKRTRKH